LPKTIDTLVTDIYGLFGTDERFDLALFEQFGGNLRDLMDFRFHQKREDDPYLRMSNIGKPDRQLWYNINYKGDTEPLEPHTLIKFAYGDMIEQMIILFAKMAGHDVQDEQSEIEVDGIKGHIDCLIDGCVVDVKSASKFSFEKFEKGTLLEPGNDPFGYVGQLAGYVEAKTPGKDGYFLAVNKELGKIALLKVPAAHLQRYKVRERIAYAREMVAAKVVPNRCYDDVPDGKSGNMKLTVGCSYCQHKFHCWPNLKTYFYSNGPRYLTKVVREPRVSEFPDEL
jgi:hypothetical protein